MIKKYVCVWFIVCTSLFALTSQTLKPDALRLYNAGNFTQAITVCKAEIEVNPKNLESYVVLSWSLLKSAQYEQAEFWATEGMKVSRYDHRLIEALGEAKYYLGKNAEALVLFQEYISLVPNGARISDVYYLTGEIYIRLGRYKHADIALTQAVRYESLNALWWTRLGYAREMAKDYRFALDAYSKAVEINPSLTDALRSKARVQAQL